MNQPSHSFRLLSAASALLLTVVFFCFTAPIQAQQQTAQLNGRVVDSGGASIPDAIVTVRDLARGFSTNVKTTTGGDYSVPLLEPSNSYEISVSHEGFKSTVQSNVILQVAQTAKIDLMLEIGAVDETITVTAAPPILDSQTSSIGQVITGQTVEDLPLNGRSTFRLIALTPGVTFNQSAYGQFGDLAVNSTFDTNFSINGGRAQSNEFLIDGVPSSAGFFDQITTLPTVDDTDQFKVEANNLSAQYGRYSGGAINVSTKSGANQYHGNVFEFFRNSALDANDWFSNNAGLPRPAFKLNIFGGTLGGPVMVPKVYSGHDRTFFFVNYQGASRIKGVPYSTLLPTNAQRQGIFGPTAGGGKGIFNPYSTTTNSAGVKNRHQFNYGGVLNTIDPTLLDPVALAIQKFLPEPTGPIVNGKNYNVAVPVRLFQNIFSGRIDQTVSQKYHLFGRYAYSSTNLTQPNGYGTIADVEGAVGTTNLKNQSFAFDNIYALTPSLTLSVDYGYARWFQYRQTLSYGFDVSTLGLPASLASAASIPMFPNINITQNYGGTNGQSYLHNGNDSHALLASLTKTIGRHTVIAGFDVRYHRINFFNVLSSTGSYNFSQAQTQGPNPVQAVGGDAYASFLLGFGSGGSIPVGSGVKLSDFYGAVYLQDNWRVTEKLALNLGVRYDGESPYTDSHNHLSFFNPTLPSPLVNSAFPLLTGGLQFAGIGGNSSSVYTRQGNNVAPRVGFAYSLHPTTVLRGGFGIAYAPLEISNNAVGFAPNLGYSSSTAWNTSTDGFIPNNLLRNPFPQGLVPPTGTSLAAKTQVGQALNVWYNNPPTPRSYQYNLDLQQQMPGGVLMDLGYVGSRGLYLTGNFDMNQLDPSYLSLGTGLSAQVPNPFQSQVSIGTLSLPKVARRQLLLPFPQFLSIVAENTPYGSSSYNSAQVKLVKRASKGLTVLVAYTWSKQISNINASTAPIGSGNSTTVQNYYNLSAERSVSELDQPQNFVANATYELPFGKGKRFLGHEGPLLDKFFGGYKLTSIWTEIRGVPLAFSVPITGIAAGRPNLTGISARLPGNRTNTQKVAQWFNRAAFAAPPSYSYGSVGRTFTDVRGPGVQNVDASLIKDAQFEHVRAEFRAEFFNVLNNPHFALPVTALNNPAYGSISSVVASPPEREVQFALKLSF